MASIVVSGDTSGAITIAAPAVAGTNTLTLPASTGTLVATGGAQTIEFAAGTVSAPSITTTGDTNTGIFFPAADTIAFTEGGAEAMRIDSSGNVGIGTSSPTNSLSINIPTSSTKGMSLNFNNASVASFTGNSSTGEIRIGGVAANWFPTFYAGTAEVGRFDVNGNLLVGTTSTSIVSGWSAKGIAMSGDLTGGAMTINSSSSTGTQYFIGFGRGGSLCGSIQSTGTNATSYSTSSDYRLKENIAPMTGALAKIAQLKPVTYTWKSDGTESQGFIAHELQAVMPDCVIGEKDAVDADGNIKPQGVDTSFLVATLTAAIQEQQQIINDLKARIETLEGAK